MSEPKGFLIYSSYKEQFDLLDDEALGGLIRGLVGYFETGEIPLLSPVQMMLFTFMKSNIDRDREKYQQTCEKRKEAIAKRWNTNVSSEIQMYTNVYKCIQKDTNDTNININDKDKSKDLFKREINKEKSEISLVVEKFNNVCISLPKVEKLTEKRKTAIKSILKKMAIDEVEKVFQMAEESDFLTGRRTDFKASFDWLIKERNAIKVLEGNYSNTPKNGTGRLTPSPSNSKNPHGLKKEDIDDTFL